jgi:hypothetical protein
MKEAMMTMLKKACMAAAIAVSTAGITAGANAQYVGVDVGPVGVGVGFPGYAYDDGFYGTGYYPTAGYYAAPYDRGYTTPSRISACVQQYRDFAERQNFRCPNQ